MSFIRKLKSRFNPPSLGNSVADLADYYETPIGKALYSEQKHLLSNALSNLFGYHLMEMSALPKSNFQSLSRVNHCFKVSPQFPLVDENIIQKHQMACIPAQLPLPDESIDVCILHHVLEFSENPHQILKEASRVTIARGHVVIVSFNPMSFLGLIRPLLQSFKKSKVWRRRSLRVNRLQDWLEFLDFSCVDISYAGHNLPINSQKYLRSTRGVTRFCRNRQWPFGSIYCIVARKDKMSVTPIKPEWNTDALSGLAKKRAYRASTNRSGLNRSSLNKETVILPFRKNINKSR